MEWFSPWRRPSVQHKSQITAFQTKTDISRHINYGRQWRLVIDALCPQIGYSEKIYWLTRQWILLPINQCQQQNDTKKVAVSIGLNYCKFGEVLKVCHLSVWWQLYPIQFWGISWLLPGVESAIGSTGRPGPYSPVSTSQKQMWVLFKLPYQHLSSLAVA